MTYKNATIKDLKEIQSILKQLNLPFEDCDEHINNFIIIEENKKIIGVGGLEIYDEIALLRSVAVIDCFQGKGFGDKIYNILKTKALSIGIKKLFILTQTAGSYFENKGFEKVERVNTPKEIRKTKQFSSLCPSSALIMAISIK